MCVVAAAFGYLDHVLVAIGSVLGWLWQRRVSEAYERYRYAVAAGLIGGEALVSGLLIPILAALGVVAR